jgi:hypothetical protein
MVLVVAVVGVLTIHVVFAAPATRVSRAAAARPVRGGPPARLLLAGSQLYSYQVAARRLQPLSWPPNVPAAALRLVAIRGGDVVVTPGGNAYGALVGKPPRPLGVVTGVLPDHDGDALWLLSRRSAQLAGADGKRYGRPFPVPAGKRVVAALDAGLVLAPTSTGALGPVEVVDPRTRRVVRTITPAGLVLSAAGDHVAWSGCAGSACPVEVTQISTGRVQPLPGLPAGYLPVGSPTLSPDNRHFAVPASRLGSVSIDLVVGRLPGDGPASLRRVAVRDLLPGAGAVQYARSGALLVATHGGLTVLPAGRSPRPTRLANVPAFTSFAVS